LKPQDERPVSGLRNLGPASARMLAEVGIRSIGELSAIGPVKAYVRVKAVRSRGASINLLWSMAAGLQDKHWHELDAEEKSALLAELRKLRPEALPPASRSRP